MTHSEIKLETNNRKIGTSLNPWKLNNTLQIIHGPLETNNTLQNNPWVKEEVPRKTVKNKSNELNENKNAVYKILRITTKTALKGKFIIPNAYIRKEEASKQTLGSHLKVPAKRKQNKLKAAEGKKIMEINTKIYETENGKTVEKNQ